MNTKRLRKLSLTTLLCLAATLPMRTSWSNEGTDGVLTNLRADDIEVVNQGKDIYQAQCAACHGAELHGQPEWRTRDANGLLPAPPHDASGHTWHHADDLLFEITKFGPGKVIGDPNYQSAMPAFANLLSDEEIVATLSYIKNSWPMKERQWQEEVNETQISGIQTIRKQPTSSWLEKLLK